jgi:hypothetical protein
MEPKMQPTNGALPTQAKEDPLPTQENRAPKARKTRMQTLTPRQRRSLARKAANARWNRPETFPGISSAQTKRRKRAGRNASAAFGDALAAAEDRLAAAIQERAYHANMTAVLDAEIPSLVQTINALKNTQNAQMAGAAAVPGVRINPLSPSAGPLVSRAQGGAFSTNLSEGEDEDQFLKESGVAGGVWH